MGEKGFIPCNCQGTCPSIKEMDIKNVVSDIRRERMARQAMELRRSALDGGSGINRNAEGR